jgi:hypothetical protein
MAKINGYTLDGWEGTLQGPTARGPRVSQVRTWVIVEDLLSAYILAYTYASLINAYAGYTVELPGGEEALGVRVISVTVVDAKHHRGGARLVVDWSLVWG